MGCTQRGALLGPRMRLLQHMVSPEGLHVATLSMTAVGLLAGYMVADFSESVPRPGKWELPVS